MNAGPVALGTTNGSSRPPTLLEGRSLAYCRALDGMRAFAVAGVLLYHAGVHWMPGGFLGVDAFFVLSGFLITSLLVTQWSATGGIALGSFWARRARRLLPALFVLVAAVALYTGVIARRGEYRGVRADAFASLGYFANWRFVFAHQSYFDQFASPSPLRHVWSLAIEEQFYLVWPLVLLGLLYAFRGNLRRLPVAVAVLACASSALMAVLYAPGHDPSRVYYGTDTRAQSLLIGALVAVAAGGVPVLGSAARHVAHGAALVATAFLAWMWTTADPNSAWLYRGGLSLAAIAVATIIVSVTQRPAGALGRLLSVAPLVWIGTISYGLYLWHWPVYLVVTADRVGLHGAALVFARLAVSLAFATASFYLVERPIRSGALRRVRVRVLVPALAVVGAVAILLTTNAAAPTSPLASIGAYASQKRPPPRAAATVASTRSSVPPTRVLLVGDSVGLTLGLLLGVNDPDVVVWDQGVLGCGVTHGGAELIGGVLGEVSDGCNHIATMWAQRIDEFNPDVVLLLSGAWDVPDHKIDGRWIRPGTRAYHDYALQSFQTAVSQLGAKGAHVVLLTSPYFDASWHDPTIEWPEFDPARVDALNGALRELVAGSGGAVTLIDLNAYVSPGGKFTDMLDGVHIRDDGVHFTYDGSRYISKWLSPQLRAIGLAHPRAAIDRHLRSDDRGDTR